MTTEQRKEAAAIMASDGPWDWRPAYDGSEWEPCTGVPEWDWQASRYRIRPAAPAPLPTKGTEYTKGPVFDNHGELARWLGNEPTIIVCDEPRACKDLLEWDAGRLFHALALGELARATQRPAEPAPLPCCPCCGDPAAGDGASHPPHYWCPGCGHYWREDRRKSCPSCTDEGKREIRHQRDVWRRRAETAEAHASEWELRGAAWDEEHAQLVQGKAKATAERDEARELLDHAKGDERRAVERMKSAEDHAAIVETQLTASRADCDHWRRRCDEAARMLDELADGDFRYTRVEVADMLRGRP